MVGVLYEVMRKEENNMRCPNCGKEMKEVSKWDMAPFGGWKCEGCGLTISKKSSDRVFKRMRIR